MERKMRIVWEQRSSLSWECRPCTRWAHKRKQKRKRKQKQKLRVLREHDLRKLRVGVSLFVAGLLGSGCATPDPVAGPIFNPASYVESMDLLEEAITLSTVPGADTVRLHVSTLFGDGSVVSEPIQFTSSDSTVVVEPSGLVTAHFPTTSPAWVYASMTHKGATRRDSAQILVLPQLPTVRMARLDLQLPSGMNAVIPALTAPTSTQKTGVGSVQLTVRGLDANDMPVPASEILISVRVTDTTVAKINAAGLVTARKPGIVYIVANTVANGIFVMDSIALRFGLPLYAEYSLPTPDYPYTGVLRLGGDTARIGVGGVVGWSIVSSDVSVPVDLIFDEPTHVEAATPGPGFPVTGPGNILGFRQVLLLPDLSNFWESVYSTRVGRRFSVPGVYRFHGVLQDSTIPNKIHGVIIVCPVDTDSCDP